MEKNANVEYPKTKCEYCSAPAAAIVHEKAVCARHRKAPELVKEAAVDRFTDPYEIPKP